MQAVAPFSSSLCSYTDQVQGSGYTPFKIKELCKEEVVDNLERLGYLDVAYRVKECGTTFVHLKCENGHEKYGRMHCQKDFCPTCGVNGSTPHKRRVVRALDRLIWAKILGYMVFTLPKEVSAQRPDKESLYYMSKKAWEIVKKNFKTPGGMVRTHLMGEEPEDLHVHINVLFPVSTPDGLGKVPQETLENIRRDWTQIVNNFFELNCVTTNVYYKFALQVGKQIHKVKYVLRPIVTPGRFLTLSDKNKHYVLSLKGWHNTRWYGKLSNCQYKEYLQSKGFDPRGREGKDIGLSRKCPVCGSPYKFVEIIHKDNVPRNQLRWVDKDTLVDFSTFDYLSKVNQN